ncbi:MAG: prepilin-type N-terminal cleavage/methylation domain-containing protein [Planctomycetes bacterium]|nr:prepilin-type N-terminal cleavage/methylation domain-containing protein [Planctomycetota bacterium]
MTSRRTRAVVSAPPRRGVGGFTFMEVLVVMAVAAVLLGLGIGFLANVGRASLATQASSMLAEAGQRCLNQSAGGKRAILEVRAVAPPGENERIEVRTAVQRTVLTANFEALAPDRAETDWFINANEPTAATVNGPVQVELAGRVGACARLQRGGSIEYGTRSGFAMTDGLEIEVDVKPEVAGGRMVVLRGEDEGRLLWELALNPVVGRTQAFDVELRVSSVPADAAEALPGAPEDLRTAGAPVAAGVWSRLRAVWDGVDSSLQVDGVERKKVERSRSDAPRRGRRLYVPPSGVVRVLTGPSYAGSVDTLTMSGIFRNDEDSRRLPYGVTLVRTPLPLRVVFSNGRLDPTVHSRDVEVRLTGPGEVETGGYTVVRYGLYGSLPPPYRVEPSVTPGAAMGDGP